MLLPLLTALSVVSLARLEPLACQVQCSSPMNGTLTEKYCQHNNLTLHGRCCYNHTLSANETTESAVGVDLHNCSLTNTSGLFENMTAVVIISLEDNPLSDVRIEDFYHLTRLEDLSLPLTNATKECPGGSNAWERSTIADDTLTCHKQEDTCHNIENNSTCPHPQSVCVPAGPGMVDCLCSPGYHGYKCLRKGSFPTAAFAGGLGGCTIVLAGALWVTQRRRVKKQV